MIGEISAGRSSRPMPASSCFLFDCLSTVISSIVGAVSCIFSCCLGGASQRAPQNSLLDAIEEQEEIHRFANQKYENFMAKCTAAYEYKELGPEHLSISEPFLVQQWLDEEAQMKVVSKYKKLYEDCPNLSKAEVFIMLLPAEQEIIRQRASNKSNQRICRKKASIEEINKREALLRQEESLNEKTTKIRFADRDEMWMFSINAPPTVGFKISIPAISRSRRASRPMMPVSSCFLFDRVSAGISSTVRAVSCIFSCCLGGASQRAPQSFLSGRVTPPTAGEADD